MKRYNVIKYFWEELNAYTLNNHRFNDGFKHKEFIKEMGEAIKESRKARKEVKKQFQF